MLTFLTTIFQLIFFYIILNLSWLIGKIFIPNAEYPNEYVMYINTIILIFILFLSNFLIRIINKNWFEKLFLAITFILYSLTWLEDLNSFPFQTILFLVSGSLTIFLKKKFQQMIRKKIEYK